MEVLDNGENSKDVDNDEKKKKKKKKKKIESIKRKQIKITDMLSTKKKKKLITPTAIFNLIN